MKIEDRELVKLVLAGQTDDFRALVERHQQAVFRFACGMLGNQEDAQDVTQETFLAAFANLSSYESSRGRLSTWLFTIARNRCINMLRRNRTTELGDHEPMSAADSTDGLARRELSQQLDSALAALPINQRSAFVLAEIEERSYDEIARIERTSLGTVKSRIHRAKKRLRALLETELGELT